MIQKLKKLLMLTYVIIIFILFAGLIFLTWFTLSDEQALVNSQIINLIAMFAILLSLPGVFAQLLTMILPVKRKLIVKQKCPNCKHLIEYNIKED